MKKYLFINLLVLLVITVSLSAKDVAAQGDMVCSVWYPDYFYCEDDTGGAKDQVIVYCDDDPIRCQDLQDKPAGWNCSSTTGWCTYITCTGYPEERCIQDSCVGSGCPCEVTDTCGDGTSLNTSAPTPTIPGGIPGGTRLPTVPPTIPPNCPPPGGFEATGYDANYCGSGNPTFYWTKSNGADYYELQVDNDLNFGSIDYPANNLNCPGSSCSYNGLTIPVGTWYWRVIAHKNCGSYQIAVYGESGSTASATATPTPRPPTPTPRPVLCQWPNRCELSWRCPASREVAGQCHRFSECCAPAPTPTPVPVRPSPTPWCPWRAWWC